jgi:polyisoprenoid-binding protein YceI
MTFVSKKIQKVDEGEWKVTGDLTIHGVTKEAVLEVEGPAPEAKDPWGNVKTGVSATTKINRTDFGLVWNAALETGGVLVGEEVTISLEIELLRK